MAQNFVQHTHHNPKSTDLTGLDFLVEYDDATAAVSIQEMRGGSFQSCFGAASARPRSRKQSAARTALGGSVAVRHDLIASGYRAGAVAIDPPWPFEHYSDRAAHAVTDHYETMTLDEIKCCRSPSWPRRTARCSL
jgi:hypothetical protein